MATASAFFMHPTPSVPVIKTVVFAALMAPPAATANAIADILSVAGTSLMKTASYSPKQYHSWPAAAGPQKKSRRAAARLSA